VALEVLKEVTEWAVDYRQPNHTYLMRGEKAIGYQKWHEGAPIYYNHKQKLDKRGRRFEKILLKDSPFKEVDIIAQ
jgi:hypothetical protein